MYENPEVFQNTAVIIPVYFEPEVEADRIGSILESTFRHQELFCLRENLLAVVDSGSAAEAVFRESVAGSALQGVRVHSLQKNRCKAGAVKEGLEILLDQTRAEYFVTRDCDGDHFLEDLPRLINFLLHCRNLTGNENICVMGSRASLAKPMGWVRQEWENLTNDFITGLLSLKLAVEGRVLDQRFWNGSPPDIQSGYRVYSREAARLAVQGLKKLPEKREILKFACEFEPFIDLSLAGGLFCQVNRLTLVEQPVSSYQGTDYSLAYGSYLGHATSRLGVEFDKSLLLFDNAISRSPLFYTDYREEVLKCRSFLDDTTQAPAQAPFV